jgi:hypothetical protein
MVRLSCSLKTATFLLRQVLLAVKPNANDDRGHIKRINQGKERQPAAKRCINQQSVF